MISSGACGRVRPGSLDRALDSVNRKSPSATNLCSVKAVRGFVEPAAISIGTFTYGAFHN